MSEEVYRELFNTMTEAMEQATEVIGQFTEALTHTPDAMGIVIKVVKLQNILDTMMKNIRDDVQKESLKQLHEKLESERERLESERKEMRKRIDANYEGINQAFKEASWERLVEKVSKSETMNLLDETWKPLSEAVHDIQSRLEGWDRKSVDLLLGAGVFDQVALVVNKVDELRSAAEDGSIDLKYVEVSEFVSDLEKLPRALKVVLD